MVPSDLFMRRSAHPFRFGTVNLYVLDVALKRSRRVSVGLERYTSLAANADRTRLLATVADSRSDLACDGRGHRTAAGCGRTTRVHFPECLCTALRARLHRVCVE
jgi:hypothetical protein